MLEGCYRGSDCICGGGGSKCTVKGVVYQATCGVCVKKEETRSNAVYIGETARQVGARAAEHLDNVRLFKKDSFILEHWMLNHSMEVKPPQFEFKVLGKFKDPLSRQVREARTIKERGNLNKRNEFALNEIINMESSRYAWQEAENIKRCQREQQVNEQCKKDFINVMFSVSELDNNKTGRSVNICTHGDNFYRLKFSKRKVPGQVSDNKGSKRVKMNSSTPYQHRRQAPIILSSPEDSPIASQNSTKDNISGGEGAEMSCQNRTNLSNETASMKITTLVEPEPLVAVLARQAVTLINHSDAETSYRKRQGGVSRNSCEELAPEDWSDNVKFKGNDSDTKSFEILELIGDNEDYFLDKLFASTSGIGKEEVDDIFDIPDWLFNHQAMMDENNKWEDDLGLVRLFSLQEDYFNEQEVDQVDLEQRITTKRKNSLYSIFRKPGLSTPKRKHSPEEDTTQKMRRMTISDCSPNLRPSISGARNRASSVTSVRTRSAGRMLNRRAMKALDPRQQLITKLFQGPKKDED